MRDFGEPVFAKKGTEAAFRKLAKVGGGGGRAGAWPCRAARRKGGGGAACAPATPSTSPASALSSPPLPPFTAAQRVMLVNHVNVTTHFEELLEQYQPFDPDVDPSLPIDIPKGVTHAE